MVLLQIDLSDVADRKLSIYKAVKGLNSKEDAVIDVLELLDVTSLSNEYFKKDKLKKEGL